MKILKNLIIICVVALMLIIYITNKDEKIYYTSIGDGISLGINSNEKIDYGYSDYVKDYLNDIEKIEFYTKKFSNKDKRITDIINDIEDNIKIKENNKEITIKKVLMKSDLITISIGLNEILYKLNNKDYNDYTMYEYVDQLLVDYEKLIDTIKKYCKEDILIIGYYNPFINKLNYKVANDIIIYSNNKLIDLCNKEGLHYVDLYNLFKNNRKMFINVNNYYPNIDGYKLISREIIKIIEKNIIKSSKTM